MSIILQKELTNLNAKITIVFLNMKVSMTITWLSCNKNHTNKIRIDLSLLLLGKGPYEYMDEWKKFNETSLSEKEDFYSNLTMDDITGSDYNHAKKS